jgi:hypothetical protein
VAEIYETVQSVKFKDQLFAELRVMTRYSLDNWGFVAQDINNQNELLEKIKKDFLDTRITRMNATEPGSPLMKGVLGFFFMLSFGNLMSEVFPEQFELLKNSVKGVGESVVKTVRSCLKKVRLRSVDV